MGTWQFTPQASLYVLAAGVSFVLAYLAWKQHPAPGAVPFSLLTFSTGIWALGYLLGFFNTDLSWKLFMLRVEYIGIICTPALWFPFVAIYTSYDQWLTRRTFALLSIIPLITFALVMTLQKHTLFYSSYELITENGLVLFSKEYGPGFYLWVGYSYINLLVGTGLLVRAIITRPQRYRGQIGFILLSVMIILMPNFLYVTGNNPIPPYDPTPISFVLASLLYMIIMRRYRFFDIVPVAHNLVFREINTGVIVINEKQYILEMNPAAQAILDCSQDRVMGESIFDVLPVYGELLEQFEDNVDIKTEIALAQGARFYELQTMPFTDHNDKLVGRIIMLIDITGQRLALDELDAYAHTVAHDLKSPLSTLLGYAEFVTKMDISKEELDASLQAIESSAENMTNIVEGLLLLAEVRDQDEVVMVPLEMNTVVERAIARLQEDIAERDARIILPESWSVARGYPVWVEEIWTNYLSNALKYGGTPPVIELGAEQQDAMVRFWVKDNGPGLSEAEQADLFLEFRRLDRHKSNTVGHGLGLSIVRRIVGKLGGEIFVESTVGEGSTFYFTLPGVAKK